mmetsp:Transcript_17829/g.17549  ORF Transcript_17829/g.17549 Transcript_17829/m.17549 type:complete len:149 (+) Transcript_17829:598-1044(+)
MDPGLSGYLQIQFKISKSTVYRLKEELAKDLIGREAYPECHLDYSIDYKIQKDILLSLVTPPKPPLTLESIKEQYTQATGVEVSKETLRKCLKEDLGYGYKRGSRKDKRSQTTKNRQAIPLYASIFLLQVTRSRLIVNIDESSFNRNI